MSNKRSTISVAVAACTLMMSGTALATNGYLSHGLGTKNKGMAGAGTAAPSEAMSIVNNPAAGVMVGATYQAGLSIFSPRRSYESTDSLLNGQLGSFTIGPDSIDSDNEYFPIPYIAGIWALDDNSAFSAAFYGRGGMNTEYRGGTATFDPDGPGPGGTMTLPGPFGAGTLGVDLSQAFLDLSFSEKRGSFNWGITGVLALQAFEVTGMANFAGFTETFAKSGGTEMPKYLSNNGHEYSYGLGVKVGAIWETTDSVNLGLSYQSKTYMTELDKYADLLADGGSFDIPASARAGISWQVSDRVSLHLDGEHIWYSDVDSIANPIDGIVNCPTAGFGGSDTSFCLGGSNGIGFGWDDMTIVKVGVEWQLQNAWTLRAGYSKGDQPIPDSQLLVNVLAPAVMEEHITFGITRASSNGNEFSVSFMYAPEKTVTGPSTFDPTQDITIEMEQLELEFAYSW
ncbi:MAG: outer membrane protein transport protein [Proteobacteria bacterium]|nr:outer membrane protein transport protein [Pseudomonadota bacterium]